MAVYKTELTEHVKNSYMSYAMSTIVDRALPDVRDGLKPVHKRILYSMYKKGINFKKARRKSTEPIAETMKIHHHGDSSIYDAISLLTEQNESLLHPFIDGEGAFGKVYSKDSPSAARYTYCRLNNFAEEMFQNIDKGVVHMYGDDKEHIQPIALPCTYPAILIKPNDGIAVGEACSWGSFNLIEIIDATIAFINNKNIDLFDYIKAPDFSTGGLLLYNEQELQKIYNAGKGSVRCRAKYTIDKKNNCIDIYEIPYSTTVDAIVDKITELMKSNKFKDIQDVRDETGYNPISEQEELKITIDVKKNTNIDILIKNLFKHSQLESSFSFHMNCLVNFKPKVLGIKDILKNWLEFRQECIKKALEYDIQAKTEKLVILKGLEKVLLDIDMAVRIIRNTDEDTICNKLMNTFNIDMVQSEHIINMKLRNINKDYIVKQIKDIEGLEKETRQLQYNATNIDEINKIIISELNRVKDQYGQTRKTEIIYPEQDVLSELSNEDLIEDYSVTMVLTKEGYLKKTLRYSEQQKLKEGDSVLSIIQASNRGEVILFSNKGTCYKLKINDLNTCQPSALGSYIYTLLDIKDEQIIGLLATTDFKGNAIITFKNGKVARIPLSSYATKNNRAKLLNALNLDSEVISILQTQDNTDIIIESNQNKALMITTKDISVKTSKNTQGVQIMYSSSEEFEVIKAYIGKLDDKYKVTKRSSGKLL